MQEAWISAHCSEIAAVASHVLRFINLGALGAEKTLDTRDCPEHPPSLVPGSVHCITCRRAEEPSAKSSGSSGGTTCPMEPQSRAKFGVCMGRTSSPVCLLTPILDPVLKPGSLTLCGGRPPPLLCYGQTATLWIGMAREVSWQISHPPLRCRAR